MKLLKLALYLIPSLIVLGCSPKSNETQAIKKLLEIESSSWRLGDSKAHAACWHIQPYSKILISTADGKMFDVPAAEMAKPIINANGGTSSNSNYKMSIPEDNAWVSHDEVSIAKDGKKRIRMKSDYWKK